MAEQLNLTRHGVRREEIFSFVGRYRQMKIVCPERSQEGIIKMDINDLTGQIIGAAIAVHKALGPGLLESVYKECLAHEFDVAGLNFEKEKPLPIVYKNVKLEYKCQT